MPIKGINLAKLMAYLNKDKNTKVQEKVDVPVGQPNELAQVGLAELPDNETLAAILGLNISKQPKAEPVDKLEVYAPPAPAADVQKRLEAVFNNDNGSDPLLIAYSQKQPKSNVAGLVEADGNTFKNVKGFNPDFAYTGRNTIEGLELLFG